MLKKKVESQGGSPFFPSSSPSRSSTEREQPSPNMSSFSYKRTSTIHYYKFLGECSFIDLEAKEFVYGEVHNHLRGVLKTEKLFSSKDSNPTHVHQIIDGVANLLLLIHLQAGKVLGAFTHEPFTPEEEYPKANISLIMDISKGKSFPNTCQMHTISYSKETICWGYN